ncbi:NAD(P)-binding domain-containing protein [Streptomyces sp. NPDC006638]|uniref:ornithine cyclodeaminase family protein n=1 Tax=Streptomyces sp. NPDC006638 TaxID=3157183 RepID=UPI0033B90903
MSPDPVSSRPASPLLFDDEDVRALDAATAVGAVRAALLAHHSGALHAPPRLNADLGDGAGLVVTAGRLRSGTGTGTETGTGGLYGFRAYDTVVGAEQLVAVWDGADGRLKALVHGSELGPRRTGAIGALAVDAAANPGPVRLGIVGAGRQAWTQLWALGAVRPLEDVVVASRSAERTAAFARRAADELGVRVRAVGAVEDAVRERNVVIVATNSTTPVLDADWIAPGTHVSTLGPKTASGHEVPAALVSRADVVLTDSRAQAAGYAEPHLFAPERMVELGAVLAGAAPCRTAPGQITVFCSVGLAGTEVALAAALLPGADAA